MKPARIFQIVYSEKTRAEIDPGFEPLDNLGNERPDWREYWPIRQFLLNQPLEPDVYYGFFSPKFRSKTHLDSQTVRRFIEAQDGGADVISFSPFFDQMALPLNIVEQTIGPHPECLSTFAQCVALVAPYFRINSSVMTSRNTLFCNYFVARPAFWQAWLQKCEQIFLLAEDAQTALARDLNRLAMHGTGTAPRKVFVTERVASLLLWAQPHWQVRTYNPTQMPLCSAELTRPELVVLDALKIAHVSSGCDAYLTMYRELRGRYMGRRQSA